jgi:hypothetical protein
MEITRFQCVRDDTATGTVPAWFVNQRRTLVVPPEADIALDDRLEDGVNRWRVWAVTPVVHDEMEIARLIDIVPVFREDV